MNGKKPFPLLRRWWKWMLLVWVVIYLLYPKTSKRTQVLAPDTYSPWNNYECACLGVTGVKERPYADRATYEAYEEACVGIVYSCHPVSSKFNPLPIPIPSVLPSAAVNQAMATYDNQFITATYPSRWYVWSFGRGVSLDYFQINTKPRTEESVPQGAFISFDIQSIGYTAGDTLAEQRKNVEQLQQIYPNQKYVIEQRMINGVPGLVYERFITDSPSYEKTVWVRKNNVKYIMMFAAFAQNQQERDMLIRQFSPDFESVVTSIRLKSVDPAEVERLGNHPD